MVTYVSLRGKHFFQQFTGKGGRETEDTTMKVTYETNVNDPEEERGLGHTN